MDILKTTLLYDFYGELLTDKQKELLMQFDETLTGKEYEAKKSFFERVKDAFSN